ncbi:MAG: hypothetical protein H7320_22180 [Ferruginibacter sp.]|nr:hypothetical protein [Ferruginibacter sp.]
MILLHLNKLHRVKKIGIISLLLVFHSLMASSSNSKAQTERVPPFQGTRKFCSDESKQTYSVKIKGSNVIIAYASVKIKGSFKKGLLLTNDPKEVEYWRYGGKHNYGKYYILKADYFSVLIPENGEYYFYTLCKQ